MMREHRALVTVFVVTTLLASAIEGVGVGMIIPLLDGWNDGESPANGIPILSSVGQYLQEQSIVNRVRLVAVVLLLVIAVQSTLRYLDRIAALRLHVRVERTMKTSAIRQLYDLSLRYIQQRPSAHLVTLVLMETHQSARIVSLLATVVASLSIMLVYTALMLVLSWQLTLTAAVLLLLIAWATRWFTSARLQAEGEATVAYRKKLRHVVIENLSLMKLSHLYAQEKQGIDRSDEAVEGFLKHFYESQKLIARTSPILNITAVFGLAVLLIAGTFLMPTQSEAWLARTAMFLLIVFRLLIPATNLNRSLAEIRNLYPSLQTVLEFLDRGNKPYLVNGDQVFDKLQIGVRLEGVTFRYDPEEDPVLINVTLEIPDGKMVAIVGASGCGKSTIVSLLARLYDPDEGCVRIDGTDLRELDLANWRSNIAIVSQEILLHNDTIMANLRFARPAATKEEIIHAARLAQLDDFVRQLPKGYDTVIGDQGLRLSGGQQQRVAIARALVADPQVLILDEATSALDSETERAIQTAIDAFSEGRTLLVAAHRLSTIRDADQIIVLDHGSIVEQGTHSELIKRNGLYRKLVRSQHLGDDSRHKETSRVEFSEK
ncbi:MAG: ABC transporter ATP-binding protein [Planctomycetaceae bacterium]